MYNYNKIKNECYSGSDFSIYIIVRSHVIAGAMVPCKRRVFTCNFNQFSPPSFKFKYHSTIGLYPDIHVCFYFHSLNIGISIKNIFVKRITHILRKKNNTFCFQIPTASRLCVHKITDIRMTSTPSIINCTYFMLFHLTSTPSIINCTYVMLFHLTSTPSIINCIYFMLLHLTSTPSIINCIYFMLLHLTSTPSIINCIYFMLLHLTSTPSIINCIYFMLLHLTSTPSIINCIYFMLLHLTSTPSIINCTYFLLFRLTFVVFYMLIYVHCDSYFVQHYTNYGFHQRKSFDLYS